MTSIIRFLFPDFRPPATVENLGVEPLPEPVVDVKELDRDIEAIFDRGQKVLAEQRSVAETR
jgi:hypothetical protein